MKRVRRIAFFVGLAVCTCAMQTMAADDPAISDPQVLDDFEDISPWRAVASDQVSADVVATGGAEGKAACLRYDFNGVSGHAAMQRTLPLRFPDNYEFSFRLRGESPINDLQFKLIDGSGENVWWVNRPKTVFPADWQTVSYRKRHVSFAWGPRDDKTLREFETIEFTIYAHEGGRGEVCFDELRLRALPVTPSQPPTPVADASSQAEGYPASAALDAHGAWRSEPDEDGRAAQWFALDLGMEREFGGVMLHWRDDEAATRYAVELSNDGRDWRTVRRVTQGDGGVDALHLPESLARHLRLRLLDGPSDVYGLAAIELLPPLNANAFFERLAAMAQRGRYPRGFSGEQTYWTVIGLDGGSQTGLLSEDGAIEVARGGFSIEPFWLLDDRTLVGWADVRIRQSLREGYLPIPSVEWRRGPIVMTTTAFADGDRDGSRLLARYELRNESDRPEALTLVLAVRPFQVNPPIQFLNTAGGVSAIHDLAFKDGAVAVDGATRVVPLVAPDRFVASPYDMGMFPGRLIERGSSPGDAAHDAAGYASGALLYRIELPAGGRRTIALDMPLAGERPPPFDSGNGDLDEWLTEREKVMADDWRARLNRVQLAVPDAGRVLADTLRTALAHVLINRHGVEIRPGTRSYGRSWIRDGAMTSEALLRLGHTRPAADFLAWYAPYQFDNGKVPCCVDYRGSDPVPENDSHGELIHLIAEVWRYGRDEALLERMWPHVEGAIRYMDALRSSERAEANLSEERRPQYGLMPPSISHEGYSAKPAYSYWDDFWALTGYKHAVGLAQALGREDAAERIRASRDEFHADLLASIRASAKQHGIDYIPGAAELGDFDATSTTIALSPAGELANLPADLLRNTFDRYWREFVARRDGRQPWDAYTPYELRTVGAFVRLGQSDRAHAALDFFFADRRPSAWNQWAEVVGREYREPRFIGDMPHGWVASDFIRSALDLFAYERYRDQAIVLAAGIPDDWLDGDGIAIRDLRTPYGTLSYALKRVDGELRLTVADTGMRMPPGGLVLPAREGFGKVRIDGELVEADDREFKFRGLPVEARIAWPTSQ